MTGSGAAEHLFQRLNEAMESTDFGWSLCLVGEDQTDKMSELTKGLRGNLETGDGKQISSGFSYWGIGPTIAWSSACNDVFYPVMKESLQNFKTNWRRVLKTMDSDRLHYVSLGVGTGDKDRAILEDMQSRFPDMIYLPVDMSSEMLRLGVKGTANVVPRDRIIPVQLDISVAENIAELKRLLRNLLGDAPILFGLLGNTLANFDDDQQLLRMLSDLLRPQDRFLLELATTRSVVDKAQAAAEEYVSSRFFREFVTSALWHNTDLTVDMESVGFHGSAEAGNRALRVEIRYHNQTGDRIRLALPNREVINFESGQSIRVYLTRKYSAEGVSQLVERCGLVKQFTTEPQTEDRRRVFGVDLLLLTNDPHASRNSDSTEIGNQIGSPRKRR